MPACLPARQPCGPRADDELCFHAPRRENISPSCGRRGRAGKVGGGGLGGSPRRRQAGRGGNSRARRSCQIVKSSINKTGCHARVGRRAERAWMEAASRFGILCRRPRYCRATAQTRCFPSRAQRRAPRVPRVPRLSEVPGSVARDAPGFPAAGEARHSVRAGVIGSGVSCGEEGTTARGGAARLLACSLREKASRAPGVGPPLSPFHSAVDSAAVAARLGPHEVAWPERARLARR